MSRQNTFEMVMALFGQGDPATRINVLSRILVDLMMEVEALREAVIRLQPEIKGKSVHEGYDIPCSDDTLTEDKAAYQAAYVESAYVLHNGAGPTSGVEKLLARFYPPGGAESASTRETLMLLRLGFSEEEIARFRAATEQAKQFS